MAYPWLEILRGVRRAAVLVVLLGLAPNLSASAAPYVPRSDAEVLAELPAGALHTPGAVRALARSRLDVALPLAQFYLSQARSTGDLRFLGLAEAALAPFEAAVSPSPQVLVLHATLLQSRHAFGPALAELERVVVIEPQNAQAWLTRATVLRVLGRYREAEAACDALPATVDPPLRTLCSESLRGLEGHLEAAYQVIAALPALTLNVEARAWRDSELGEMAERRGDDAAAERWFREGLQANPTDLYLRNACADLLLRQHRPAEVLTLLRGYESMEPMRLRIALAEKMQRSPALGASIAMLSNAFALEAERGDAVHRREQARFLLEVVGEPAAALAVAEENWRVQREPDDLLVLLRAAQAAHRPEAASPARAFMAEHRVEDVRLTGVVGGSA
jgi:tetratricopeptide (TPR) repeat protein